MAEREILQLQGEIFQLGDCSGQGQFTLPIYLFVCVYLCFQAFGLCLILVYLPALSP